MVISNICGILIPRLFVLFIGRDVLHEQVLSSENWTANGNEASFLALQKARTSSKYPLLFTNYNPETSLSTSSQPHHPNGVNPPSGFIALNSAGPSKSTLSFSLSSTNFLNCSAVRWASADDLIWIYSWNQTMKFIERI